MKKQLGNIASFASLLSALMGVTLYIYTDNYYWVLFGVILSVVFDVCDGNLSRRFGGNKDIGKQIDSLVDVVVFAVVPFVYVVYTYHSLLLFALAFFYVVCGVWRLARFNVHSSPTHYTGLPITVAALILVVLLTFVTSALFVGIILLVLGILMVSTFTFKKLFI